MKTIEKGVQDYLTLRCSLGFKLKKDKQVLRQFVVYMKQKRAPYVTTKLAVNFATIRGQVSPNVWGTRLGIIRRFAHYWKATDARTEVPPDGLLPIKQQRQRPYIYTDADIKHLLTEASKLPSVLGLRRVTYSSIFGLLVVTGLRISEAIALDVEDVDLKQGFLRIRLTKFGKSRWVPIHSTTVRALRKYAKQRDRIIRPQKTSAFFVSEKGKRTTPNGISYNFIAISKRIGLRKVTDSRGPRIHDFRHNFAIRTLIRWYRAGLNVDEQIPLLVTYLGHTQPRCTYWYLTAVPELMGVAASRLEKQLGGMR